MGNSDDLINPGKHSGLVKYHCGANDVPRQKMKWFNVRSTPFANLVDAKFYRKYVLQLNVVRNRGNQNVRRSDIPLPDIVSLDTYERLISIFVSVSLNVRERTKMICNISGMEL